MTHYPGLDPNKPRTVVLSDLDVYQDTRPRIVAWRASPGVRVRPFFSCTCHEYHSSRWKVSPSATVANRPCCPRATKRPFGAVRGAFADVPRSCRLVSLGHGARLKARLPAPTKPGRRPSTGGEHRMGASLSKTPGRASFLAGREYPPAGLSFVAVRILLQSHNGL